MAILLSAVVFFRKGFTEEIFCVIIILKYFVENETKLYKEWGEHYDKRAG